MLPLPKFDTRHLQVFQVLFKLRSVSKVSEYLSVPQSTVSRSLAHLRAHFNDQLFIATKNGMMPTPKAENLSPSINKIVEILQHDLKQDVDFEPTQSTRRFRIAASDTGHLLLLPKLYDALKFEAPDIRFEAVDLSDATLSSQLQSGEVDLAIGGLPELYTNIKEQRLFSEFYQCFVRKTYAEQFDTMSKEEFYKADHIIISVQGMGHFHQAAEKVVSELIGPAKKRFVVHSFYMGVLVAEQVDAILTAPSRVVSAIGQENIFRAFSPPLDLPGFDVKQYWHERFDKDPANIWLRNRIFKLFRLESE